MKLALIGATGGTGAHVLTAALDHRHEVTVLVRDPERLGGPVKDRVRVVVGSATDRAPVHDLLTEADAVVSALGPTSGEADLHTRVAHTLVAEMSQRGPRRFVGVSAAGIDVPGDDKTALNRMISFLIQRLGGAVVNDKPAEYAVWAASELDWTLVRPPRLVDRPPTGHPVEHDAHRSTKSTSISRTELGQFVIHVVEDDLYLRQAPFVASRPKA
ncbi:MAG: NAD(P)H-binding protein [Microlunatus sp.]|nr:NAD(P)H-binding protein [Microlunatus sp.]MDN5771576.1 NAD(P)H-binding protein [Microlunatus sp.]MDN5805432.1 NAD(P)H-binding protein [Microlunatus sp.]